MLSMVFVGSCCGEYRLEITWRNMFLKSRCPWSFMHFQHVSYMYYFIFWICKLKHIMKYYNLLCILFFALNIIYILWEVRLWMVLVFVFSQEHTVEARCWMLYLFGAGKRHQTTVSAFVLTALQQVTLFKKQDVDRHSKIWQNWRNTWKNRF